MLPAGKPQENAQAEALRLLELQVGVHDGGSQVPGLNLAPVPVGSVVLKQNEHGFK